MKNAWAQKVARRVRWQYPHIYALVHMEETHRTREEARARRKNKGKWFREYRRQFRAEKKENAK